MTFKKKDNVQITPDATKEVRYQESFPLRAYKLTMLGLTEKEMAIAFDVSPQTISNWKRLHHKFRRALIDGSIVPDSEANLALFKRVVGYTYSEEKVYIVDGVLEKRKVNKHIPPSIKAAEIWLSRKRRKTWGNDKSITFKGDPDNPVEIRHTAGHARIEEGIDLTQLSTTELATLEKLKRLRTGKTEQIEHKAENVIDVEIVNVEEDEILTDMDDLSPLDVDETAFDICNNCKLPLELCNCEEINE